MNAAYEKGRVPMDTARSFWGGAAVSELNRDAPD